MAVVALFANAPISIGMGYNRGQGLAATLSAQRRAIGKGSGRWTGCYLGFDLGVVHDLGNCGQFSLMGHEYNSARGSNFLTPILKNEGTDVSNSPGSGYLLCDVCGFVGCGSVGDV